MLLGSWRSKVTSPSYTRGFFRLGSSPEYTQARLLLHASPGGFRTAGDRGWTPVGAPAMTNACVGANADWEYSWSGKIKPVPAPPVCPHGLVAVAAARACA